MITNLTRQTTVATDVEIARNLWQRTQGLLGREGLPQGRALIIPYCESIHMFFMKFPIDVIFCDRNHKVVGLCANIKPFCMSPIFFKASYAIELPAGSIASSHTQKGDALKCPPLP
ncbi:MAG: DUF192 domain-containing protein [Candidatus Omnitrophica bacterium]|nr:DUF192 domain-containing protein [Candidatus Omnitrophota bacterium]